MQGRNISCTEYGCHQIVWPENNCSSSFNSKVYWCGWLAGIDAAIKIVLISA